ncbi:zinc-ribbon domain-containing protein [Amphibacillus cookii]|uniref:zinc-ribbon domain-containing protein n=1 Tax=Amphibacillus cookii TaxID=767787 RepID=UPI00195DAD7E|nr:tetratricopeptide (TPR) repeat protein [Amphibacillus cookii]
MAHCPYCGAKVYEDEIFCINCGDKLPDHIEDRILVKRRSAKTLVVPAVIVSLTICALVACYFFNYYQQSKAKSYYRQAEDAILVSDYDKAHEYIERALNHYPNFPEAQVLHQFAKFSVDVLTDLTQADDDDQQLQILYQAITELDNYSGEAADPFHDLLHQKQTDLQLMIVENKLNNEPSIHDLPAILWEAEGIQDPDAYELVSVIREQISAHTSNQANTYLQNNQFTEAKDTVENGLYYLPNDDKLQSLLETINKEQDIFTTELEVRMEQAISQYEEEADINQNDAVEIIDVDLNENNQGHLVVSGEISSLATIPIHTIQVHYVLRDQNDKVIETNDVYVYPDTLYPEEKGQFDHTYFDESWINDAVHIQVESITWLLD